MGYSFGLREEEPSWSRMAPLSICIQPREIAAEVDGPDAWGDLLESDVLAAEQVADVDPASVPADTAVGADFADLEVSRVVRRADLRGERSG